MRSAIAALVRARRAEGESWDRIARRIGLSATTIQRWAEGDATAAPSNGGGIELLPVSVIETSAAPAVVTSAVPSVESGGVRLTSPGGYTLAGISATDAVALFRSLP